MCGSAWSREGKRREGGEVGRGGGRAGKQREGTSSYPRLALLLATSAHQVFFCLPPHGEQGLGPGPFYSLCVIPSLGTWTMPHEGLHCSIRLPGLSKMPTRRSWFWLEFDSGSERNCLQGLLYLSTEAGAAEGEGNGMRQGTGDLGVPRTTVHFKVCEGISVKNRKTIRSP